MEIKECSKVGKEVLDNNYALILGVSINNSYFKEDNLEKLLRWASSGGRPVYVMIPDEPATHTLMARGKAKNEAERLARLKSNSLENKCRNIIQRLNLSSVKIVRWEDIKSNEYYTRALSEIEGAYNEELSFKHALREMTRTVLMNGSSQEPTEQAIDVGVRFLFQEFAFIVRADDILGQEKVAYVYHKTMNVMKEIIENRYLFTPGSGVGFITAE